MKWPVLLLIMLVIVVLVIFKRYDGFGATSPGTMVPAPKARHCR